MVQMLTSVIYQNESQTTTLLDLPASIENGQYLGAKGSIPRLNRIFSANPPDHPYPSIEPKGLKRTRVLENIPRAEQEYHHKLQGLISDSLREIRSALGQRQWLRTRHTTTPLEQFDQMSREMQADEAHAEPPIVLSSISNFFSSVQDIADSVVSNPSEKCTRLVLGHHAYCIPPRSAFMLSDVRGSSTLRKPFPKNALPGAFDFIVMDPPWPNRSARHVKAYRTSEDRDETPFLCVLPILQSHLKSDGYVGIWVTNKASIRQLVLSSLHQQGFQLFQEWIWVKITTNGEPVTPLDGLWRRPYEVLLLFRKGETSNTILPGTPGHAEISTWAIKVPYRIFVAVPDYHSRKPCLKEFIEPMLVDAANYQALEVFARNLTADWFCWGDEVLKFNWERHWTQID